MIFQAKAQIVMVDSLLLFVNVFFFEDCPEI